MLDTEIEEQQEDATEDVPGKYVVLCKRCRFHLTGSDYAIAMEGHHEHVQCNPHGHTFVFRCFSRVPGAILAGESTHEHSWFSGYSWKFCYCQGCGEHLGWYFRNHSGDTFFGLITENIVVVERGSDD